MSTSTDDDRNDGLSRRRFLALSGAAAGTAAAVSLLPPSVQAAIANPAPAGGLDQIRHVVLIMQENRSFDHYFGTLRGTVGYGDRTVVRRRGGGTVFEQPVGNGTVELPFGVRAASARQAQELQYIASLPHGFPDGVAAWNRGWFDGWVPAKGPATMAGYDRLDIPFQFELAETFTLCDQYFCSVPSSTSPNRNYWISGYTGFEPNSTARAVTNAAYDEDHHPGYDWVTYPELLEKAGVSWQCYHEWDNFGDNQVEFFASFKAVMAKVLAPIEGGIHKNTSSFYDSLPARSTADQNALLAQLDASVAAQDAATQSLFNRGLRRLRPDTLAPSFAADIAAGKLPAVSYIVPSSVLSEHPGSSSPVQGAHVVYDVLNAIASHPDTWRHTAVFLNFDEFDGYYDHVPQPVAPHSVTDEYFGGNPIGLGMRVPMIVVSPWTVGGVVCSEVFDHTSTTQFLERWTGVKSPVISSWRRTVAGDLLSTFDFTPRTKAPKLDQPGPVPPFNGRWKPVPPADQKLPTQEPGTRPARPVPYQPDASAALSGGNLHVTMTNRGPRSVHLAVYGWAGETAEPVHLDVAKHGDLDLTLAGPGYDVSVTGPNRFRRDFAGSEVGKAAGLTVTSDVRPFGRQVVLTMTNTGPAALDVTVAALAYSTRPPIPFALRPGQTRSLPWFTDPTQGWYDLSVTVAQDPSFKRRLTGHVENGWPSVTG